MLLPSTRLVTATLAATLALVPLLILPGVSFYYDVTPKVVVLLAGTAVALLLGRRAAAAGSRERRWFSALLAAQGVSLVLSTVFSADRTLSLTGTTWRRFGLLAQLAVLLYAWLVSFESRRPLLRALAASGCFAALYGIAQYAGWDPWIPKQQYHIGEGVWTIVRPPGTLGHAAYFTIYLLHVAAAGAALLAAESKRLWKWTGAVAVTLSVAAIVLSGTRSAMLGLATGAALLAARRAPRLTFARVAMAAVVLAGGVAFYFSPAGLQMRARTRWFLEDPRGGERPALWADTLRMVRSRWVAGYGLETFSFEFPRFLSERLAVKFPDRYYESPHNIFLDALAAQGVAGALILAGLIAVGWLAARKRAAETDALAAGLLASVVANQFSAFTAPTALLFYSTIALLCSGPAVAAMPARSRFAALAPVTAVVLLAGALPLARSDFWLARTRDSIERGDFEQAMASYQRARRWALPGLGADLWYSRALVAVAPKIRGAETSRRAWQEAFSAAQRAAQRSEDRHNAYYNLAAFYALQSDFAHTEQNLRSAISWAPLWYKPHWMLARLLEQESRLNEAAAEARRAVDLDGAKDPEVIQTACQIEAARLARQK